MKTQYSGVYSLKKEKFDQMINILLNIFSDDELYLSFLSLKDSAEIFDFFQFVNPGNYSLDDIDKFIGILLINMYKNSKQYISKKEFEYTMNDIKKNGGPDYISLFEELSNHDSRVKDENLTAAGGIGGFDGRRFKRILAGGLALTVPFTSGLSTISAKGTEKTTIRKKGKIKDSSKRSWIRRLWDNKVVKGVVIGGSILAVLGGIYLGHTKYKEYSSKKKLEKDLGLESVTPADGAYAKGSAEDATTIAAMIKEKEKILDSTDHDVEYIKRKLAGIGIKATENKKKPENNNVYPLSLQVGTWKTNVPDGKYVTVTCVNNEGKKVPVSFELEQDRNWITKDSGDGRVKSSTDFFDSNLSTTKKSLNEEMKKSGGSSLLDWKVFAAIGGGYGILKSFTNEVGSLGKSITEIFNTPKQFMDSWVSIKYTAREWDNLFPKTQPEEQKFRTYSSEEIYNNLTKVIKGQDAAVMGLSEELEALIMKTKYIQSLNGQEGDRQMISGCSVLMGPPGSGKSRLLTEIKNNVPYYIRCVYLDLSKWDGKEAINTYISKQKEFETTLSSLNDGFAILFVEELDKICSTPEKKAKWDEFAHTLYDSGRLGGGEKNAPVQLKGAHMFCTSNAIADAEDFEENRVIGVTLKDWETGADKVAELAAKGGRSVPKKTHGSTKTRQKLYEFSPPDDAVLPDVIEANLLGMCEKVFEMNDLDIQWNRKCLSKLASLIHTKKYMAGGNRKIVKDITEKLWGLIVKAINPPEGEEGFPEDEEGVTHVYLDFRGVTPDGDIDLRFVSSESEAENLGEGIIVEDEGGEFTEQLSPDMENYILSVKLNYLSNVLASLTNALIVDDSYDWGQFLDNDSSKCISDLVNLVSKSSPDVNKNIKSLKNINASLLNTLKSQKIPDTLWDSIKTLGKNVKTTLVPNIKKIKHHKDELNTFEKLGDLLSNLTQYDSSMKLLGKNLLDPKSSNFAMNNSVSISNVCNLFNNYSPSEEDSKDEKIDKSKAIAINNLSFLLNLKDTSDAKSGMSEQQIKYVNNLNNNVIKQIDVTSKSLSENIDQIVDEFKAISNILSTSDKKIDIYSVLGDNDNNVLTNYANLIPNASSNKENSNKPKLDLIINNLDSIKEKLKTNGATQEQIGELRAIKFKINDLINPKIETERTDKIELNNDLKLVFNSLKSNSKQLVANEKLLGKVDSSSEFSNKGLKRVLSALVNNWDGSVVGMLKYIADDENNEDLISHINKAYSDDNSIYEGLNDFSSAIANFVNSNKKQDRINQNGDFGPMGQEKYDSLNEFPQDQDE